MSTLRFSDRLMISCNSRKLAQYRQPSLNPSAASPSKISSPGYSTTANAQSLRTDSPKLGHIHSLFINALVNAGRCHQHQSRYAPSAPSGPRRSLAFDSHRRPFASKPENRQEVAPWCSPYGAADTMSGALPSRTEYLNMLDHYDIRHTPQNYPFYAQRGNPDPPAIESLKAPRISDPIEYQNNDVTKQDTAAIDRAIAAIEDGEVGHENLYRLYKALPRLGVLHLSLVYRNKLLERLAEERNETSTLQYLSIIDDMKRADIPLSKRQWEKSMYLAGRCLSKVTFKEVESALEIWKEMEGAAGIRSGVMTFNILFDIAIKGRQLVLADMFLKEMVARQLPFDRFTYCGLITLYGIKGDGAGVRQAYRDLILASEIVDTVVLNCVIAALVEAGEPSAAMQTYGRMIAKATENLAQNATLTKDPSREWEYPPSKQDRRKRGRDSREESRGLGYQLARLAAKSGNIPGQLARLQRQQSLSPDLNTYIILVKYHVDRSGELQPIAALLDEMYSVAIPIHGALFLQIFRGFSKHGNEPYTSWTSRRLRDVWQAFHRLTDSETQDVYVGKWTVIWILRAYAKCLGKPETMHIWEELKSRWKDASEDDLSFAVSVMEDALERKTPKQKRGISLYM